MPDSPNSREAIGVAEALPLPQLWWWEHLRDLKDPTVEKGSDLSISRTGRHMRLWKETSDWIAQLSALAFPETERWVNTPNHFQIGRLSYTYWARLSPESDDTFADVLHIGLQLSKRIKWTDELSPKLSQFAEQPVLALWASTNDNALARCANEREIVRQYGQVQLDDLLARTALWLQHEALVRGPGTKGSLLQPAADYLDARRRGVLPDLNPARVTLWSPIVTIEAVRRDPAAVSRMVLTYLQLLALPVRAVRKMLTPVSPLVAPPASQKQAQSSSTRDDAPPKGPVPKSQSKGARSVEQRLEQLERTVQRIAELQKRAMSYQNNDPETALMHARKAAEAICRSIFVQEINRNVGSLMLDELIQKLTAAKVLPRPIQVPLRTIQAFGNLGAHEQDDVEEITPEYVQSCLQSLSIVVDWYQRKYGASH